jgi:protein-L-isoaspartate(D-aspartate) O-methyltransferase
MPGDRALEVGTGSGYQAAILASLGAQVYTIERNPQLVAAARDRLVLLGYEGIEVIWGDGTEGYAPASPYQVIMVTAAAPEVPPPLFEQLANGGRLVIPLGDMARQDLYLMIKEGDWMTKHVLDPCMFVPLIGKYGWPERPGWIN